MLMHWNYFKYLAHKYAMWNTPVVYYYTILYYTTSELA